MYTPKVDERTIENALRHVTSHGDFCTFADIHTCLGLSRKQWMLRHNGSVPVLNGSPKLYQIKHVARAITGYKFTRN